MLSSVLHPERHKRLLADVEHILATAGVQRRFLEQSMTAFCGPEEIEWVKGFHTLRDEGVPGLLLNGVPKPDTRCQAIAAALLRNFIDARFMSLNHVLELKESGELPSPTVMLIPNLYLSSVGKALPAWKIQILYDVLLQRSAQNKPSVVYVENLNDMAKAYGEPFADFLSGFKAVK